MKRRKGDYHRLKRKLFTRIVLLVLLAFFSVFFLRTMVRGYLGNILVELICAMLSISYDSALGIYDALIRENMNGIMAVSIVILSFFFIRLFVSWMTGYFDDISRGIDLITDTGARKIELLPELETVENRLNQLKIELETRTNEAKEAEQRKNDLVMYLAHDIRTPLTSVIGYLSLLEEANAMPEQQRLKYTHIALEKANRLENLVDEFFEITRFNLQRIPLEKRKFNLSLLLRQLADEFYPIAKAEEKQIEIVAPEELYLYGDADKLARVFNNILKNALAYSNQKSSIKINAKMEDTVIVTISNKGETIPPEKLETIFEKFYRLDQSRSSRSGGAGLGLAIAKEIVTAHGGSITAESADCCTQFTIVLPMGEHISCALPECEKETERSKNKPDEKTVLELFSD